jgi:glycosyltransferase involved in cell wall biosynthesis
MTQKLLLIYQMDPRGAKFGGIETHLRLLMRRHPDDFRVLFVGVDESGDLPLGKVTPVTVGGREIDFFPVAHLPEAHLNRAAKKLWHSATLKVVLGTLRHLPALHRAVGGGPATAELQRFETALVARALGLPAVQVVHGEGSRNDRMDSLIRRFWFLHALNEKIALRLARKILCVNPNIVRRIAAEWPGLLPKAEVMTVSVDTDLFPAEPFDTADGVFRVVFSGRLDEFKDPPLMFATMAELHRRTGGAFEFHYVGTSDPARYAEFAAIAPFTVRHGFQSSEGVGRITAACHAGVLTSFFEGMPCYLLEVLAKGRPVAAIRLPQYDPLVVAGTSGHLVERAETPAESVARLADAFMRLRDEVLSGRIDPAAVHARVRPFSVDVQMGRLFDIHRALARGVQPPAVAAGAFDAPQSFARST